MEHSKRKNKIKNKRYSILIMIGVFFIFLGSSYLIYNQYNNEKQDSINDGLIEDYFKVEDEIIETPQKEIEEEKPVPKEKIDYIAVLEIPKIKLKRGIVVKYANVPHNDVTIQAPNTNNNFFFIFVNVDNTNFNTLFLYDKKSELFSFSI